MRGIILRVILFEALYLIIECVRDHFGQPGGLTLQLLLKATSGDDYDEFKEVAEACGDDFNLAR